MLFNTIPFFVFAAIFFPVYFATRGSARITVLLISSYIFYGWWDWRFCFLLIWSTLLDFVVGRAMAASDDPVRRKILLILSLISNLGTLAVFKYFDFFSASFTSLLNSVGVEATPFLLNVILPVGISFYTFQTLSYTIDLYRRDLPAAEPSLLRFAAYVALFPQLVAGPIVRARTLLPQLAVDQRLDLARIGLGLQWVVWGFFLKLCLADNAAIFVDARFDRPELYDAPSLALATFLFSFQIYGDFAGYSLIAIGLGKIMGFDFGINFNKPYHATSFSNFWQRWHISLSSWIRDYIYIPLGGNRGGEWFTARNLTITMLLGGLWHGAAWTFVVWGLLHGAYLSLQRAAGVPAAAALRGIGVPRWLVTMLAGVVVYLLVCLAWIPFRAATLADAWEIVRVILTWETEGRVFGDNLLLLARVSLIALFVYLCDTLGLVRTVVRAYNSRWWLRLLGAVILLWGIALFGSFDGTRFIYFQF
ncbi:MAG: MBOAT family O-acyltransferase [Pseudomonadota bacterium]